VRGPLRAAEAKRAAGATAAIGFAVVPGPEPDANGFWAGIGNLGGSDFAAEADYAGIDMYPDVFGPPTGIDGLPCGAVGVADLPQADAAASGCRRWLASARRRPSASARTAGRPRTARGNPGTGPRDRRTGGQ